MKKIMITIGTRPEAIKMASVIRSLESMAEIFKVILVSTAQHREMLDQVMEVFGLRPDFDLDIMRPNQTLSSSTARALEGMGRILSETRPDMLLVQGDTNTVLAGALAAHYNKVPVGHVEAGLRTDNPYLPFPEEMNRRLTSRLTTLHFAPTQTARENLLQEGVDEARVFVTGNTVIDALLWTAENYPDALPDVAKGILDRGNRLILVTAHRRESLDYHLANIARAIKDLVQAHSDIEFVYPVHLNPKVQKTIYGELGDMERVHLIKPVNYPAFVQLMKNAYLVLTDSGGVQEEAPTFGKPVLVMREVTERAEAVEAGVAQLVGMDRANIVDRTSRLIESPEIYAAFAKKANPFGDGRASERIAELIRSFFQV